MTDRYEHLPLPVYSKAYTRLKQGGGSSSEPRAYDDRVHYYERQVQQLASIKRSLKRDKSHYQEFLDPSLIFKLEITDYKGEEAVRKWLTGMGIEVMSPSPGKKGFWVVFSEDDEVTRFEDKLRRYAQHDRFKFFNGIGELQEIPVEEKIGPQLAERPLQPDERAYLDLDIWRMEDTQLEAFVAGLKDLVASVGGKVVDRMSRASFCLVRVLVTQNILDQILPLREIASVDRPPKPYFSYTMLRTSLEDVVTEGKPGLAATAIGILDSGIVSGHPLLASAVGDEIAISTRDEVRIKAGQPVDDVGHGTQVAGIALYGDLRECLETGEFVPELWILSAKVMYAERNPITNQVEAKYDEEELFEHQLERAVRYFREQYPNCRIINLSLGNEYARMYGNRRQFNLAALIDELAKELDLIFIVAIGNVRDCQSRGYPDNYPDYLMEDTDGVRLIDPSSAALAITVGSITQEYGPDDLHPSDILYSPADTGYPSPFTRVGPGYQGMVKPELVEEGGNIIEGNYSSLSLGGFLLTLNHSWLTDAKLFVANYGTSLSTPKVAHMVARLYNRYPLATANFIKALLIASARMPNNRPGPFKDIDWRKPDVELCELLRVYGYGKPDLQQALSSTSNHVLLTGEGTIGLDQIDIFSFYLPAEFVNVSGTRRLSVTLVYNPPTNKNRVDYLGCSMEFRMYHDTDPAEIIRAHPRIGVPGDEDQTKCTDLDYKELKLKPGANVRKRGVHQRGVIEYTRDPPINNNEPLVLVVLCQNRWIRDENYQQQYAVVVSVEHSLTIDLYNQLRLRNQERVRVSLR